MPKLLRYARLSDVSRPRFVALLVAFAVLASAVGVGPAAALAGPATTDTLPETPIGPGTTLRQFETETAAGPQRIGVVSIDQTNPLLEVRAVHAGPPLTSRATVADQARRPNGQGETVIAAVNGDFYDTGGDYAGIPVGGMVVDGELLLNPWGAALGITADGTAFIGTPNWHGRVEVFDEHGTVVASQPLAGVNRRRDNDRIVLYTAAYGATTATNEWGAEAVIVGAPLPITPAMDVTGVTAVLHPGDGLPTEGLPPADSPQVVTNKGNSSIPADGIVLSGHGQAGRWLTEHVRPGRTVRIVFTVDKPWDNVQTVIGGQPILLAGGQIAATASTGPMASTPAPRTAAGIDANGRLVFVTVDGRQDDAKGVTLPQLAMLLRDLGLRDALNLDGGGSTTLYGRLPGYLNAGVLNKPSDGTSRRVANSLQVVSRAPTGSQISRFWIDPPEHRVLPGTRLALTARAQDEYHGPVDLSRRPVTWSVAAGEGSATIDANGQLTATAPGEVVVTAHVDGETAVATVHVLGLDDLGDVRLKPTPAATAWKWGQTVQLGLDVSDRDGKPLAVNAEAIVWEADPDLGTIDGTRLTLAEDFPAGQLRAGLRLPAANGDDEDAILPLGSWTFAIAPDGGAEAVFPDTMTHWARRDISALTRRQVVRGYPDGLFRPDGPVTRAEMVQMLVGALRAYGTLPADGVAEAEPFFADLDELPEWALPAIGLGQLTGLVSGYEDGTFRAGEQVTREQAVVMLIRAAELAGVSLDPVDADDDDNDDADVLTDLDAISGWALEPVWRAQQAGLVRGYDDGSFRPKVGLTRSQAAAFLVRLLGW